MATQISNTHPSPTYRKLFGDTDYYSVDPARSVLSPAAYFVELMELVENQITLDTSIEGVKTLKERRPDLWDKITLDDKNTETEISKLDRVIDVLESYLNKNQVSFSGLSNVHYPFDLPYDKHLAAIRAYLKQNKLTLGHIWKNIALPPFTAKAADVDSSIHLESLKISSEQWKFYTTSKTDTDALNAAYGLSSGDPITTLGNADIFMERCGIDRSELNDLIYQDLDANEIANGDNSRFFINTGSEAPIVIIENNILNLTAARLDGIHRFIRLSNVLGWSYADLDWALYCVGKCGGQAPDISDSTLPYLAWINSLQGRGLSFQQSCAMIWKLKDVGLKNGPSPFEQVFNNQQVRHLPAWPSDSLKWDPSQVEYQNELASVLGLSHENLVIIGSLFSTPVTLDSSGLAHLYQLSLAPQITGLSLKEIMTVSDILPPTAANKTIKELLASGGAEKMIEAFKALIAFNENLTNLPLTLNEIHFVVTGKTDDPSIQNSIPTGDTLNNFISELKAALNNTLLTSDKLKDALGHSVKSGLIQALNDPNLTDALTNDQKLKLHEALKHNDSYVEDIIKYIDNGLADEHYCESGIARKSELDTTAMALFEQHAIDPVIHDISAKIGQTPVWASTEWQTALNAVLSKYHNLQEQTLQNHLAGICQLTPTRAKSLKSWGMKYLQSSDPSDSTAISWLVTLVQLVQTPHLSKLTSLLTTLQRVAFLINNFSLSDTETNYFLNSYEPANTQSITFATIQEINTYRSLTSAFSDTQNKLLDMIKDGFSLSNTEQQQAFVNLTGWDLSSIQFLIQTSQYPDVASINITNTQYLETYFQLTNSLGIDTRMLWNLVELSLPSTTTPNPLNETVANALFGGLQSILGAEAPVLKTVEDKIKEDLRNRLVAITMKHLNITAKRDLFSYFLIDAEVDGSVQTSKVREVISAVQLYIQRCLNHLEPGITFSTTANPTIQTLWKWMYSYREWLANREVFLFPENYIEPQLRQDCSPEFNALIRQVRHIDRTDPEAYKEVFKTYFKSIASTASIQILSIAQLDPTNPAPKKTYFMVGRTQNDPKEYYYRIVHATKPPEGDSPYDNRYLTDIEWGYWKKIDGHLHPVIYNDGAPCISPKFAFGKWHVFWLEQKMSSSTTSSSVTPGTTNSTYSAVQNYTVNCQYMTLDANGNWGQPQTGASFDSGDLTGQTYNYLTFHQHDHPDANGEYKLNVTCTLNVQTGNAQQGFQIKGYAPGISKTIWKLQPGIEDTSIILDDRNEPPRQYPMSSTFLSALEAQIQQRDGIDKLFGTANTSNSGAKNDLINNVPVTNYFWELLFHAPFLIAQELQTHQLFIEAKKWYEYIFNPQQVATDGDSGNDRFWRFPGLRSSINTKLDNELARTELQNQIHDLVASSQISASETDPFDPHAIADLRPIAYQKTIFSHYFLNLQNWGDQCMTENTRESLNEAEMLYVIAADLLGHKPEDLGTASSRPSTTYENIGGSWTSLTNSGQTNRPRGITCISRFGSEIWVGTKGEGLWMSTDEGTSWSQQTDDGFDDVGITYSLTSTSKIISIESTQDRVFIVLVAAGTSVVFYREHDGHWNQGLTPGTKILQVHSMVMRDGVPLVGDHSGRVFQFDTSATNNWKLVINAPAGQSKPVDKLLIHGTNAYIFAGGYYKSDLSGTSPSSPTAIPNTPTNDSASHAVLAFDGVNIIAGSNLTHSSDGNQWSTPSSLPGTAGFFATNQNSWLVLFKTQHGNPSLSFSTDMGQSWSSSTNTFRLSYDLINSIRGIYYINDNDANLWQSSDNGYSWQKMSISNGTQSLRAIGPTVFYTGKEHLYVGSDSLWSTPLPYFEAPQNIQILGYWDKINQRLYDINHGLTLDGVPDVVPLFASQYGVQSSQPLGLSAEALEQELGSGIDTIPHYRFSYMIEKAKSSCDNLRGLGAALLSAMESKDASHLANLFIQNEKAIQSMDLLIKGEQIAAAKSNFDALRTGQKGVQDRIDHYRGLIDGGLISDEITQVGQKSVAITLILGKLAVNIAAAYGYLQPKIFGLADGGMDWGKSIDKPGSVLEDIASTLQIGSDIAGIHAEHNRREAEWNDQWQVALNDYTQATHQMNAADHALSAVKSEMERLTEEIEQKQNISQFYLQRFTNEQLYQWFVTQISTLYFQSYQMTLQLAVQAENARKFEQNTTTSAQNFITPGYWNNLHQGLLAGDKLYQDLLQMEKHYMDHNSRPLFIEKNISLAGIDQFAFFNLITTGSCIFDITEKDYDFDFPGHYNRRISKVSIYVELHDGVSGHVNATLTQLANKTIAADDPTNGTNAVQYLLSPYSSTNSEGTKLTNGNTALISNISAGQSVVMAQGPTDPVMQIIYANDSRYLPFEGTGAVSSWMLEMPFDNNTLDLKRIKDIKMNISYTAYTGSSGFKKAVLQARGNFKGLRPMPMSKAFPEAWANFTKPSKPKALSFELDPQYWRANGTTYNIDEIKLLVIAEEDTAIPALTLTVPDSAGAKTVSFEASPNMLATGNVPTGTGNSTEPYSGTVASSQATWSLQSTTGSGAAAKEAKMPDGLKEVFLLIEYSVAFPVSS